MNHAASVSGNRLDIIKTWHDIFERKLSLVKLHNVPRPKKNADPVYVVG